MIYLTFNDQPSGVYSSQVSDVCNFLNWNLQADIKLVAFISLHNFSKNRKAIKKDVKNSIVLPALPKAKYWRFNAWVFAFICLITGEKTVIARNVLATNIALLAKKLGIIKGICLDGRGAIAAEWNEYKVVPDDDMKKAIFHQEKKAVVESDFRISISSKLIKYWNDSFQYEKNDHVVIPCTLDSRFKINKFDPEIIESIRREEGFDKDDIIMVYSGSTAGWQSFGTIGNTLGKLLLSSKKYKLLFLTGKDEYVDELIKSYPGQIIHKWVKFGDVQNILLACDYGILIRENSVTNQVASPTKFAEYLSAGLPVIISENLGDYSAFVKENNCGIIISDDFVPEMIKPTYEEKINALNLAQKAFTKISHFDSYERAVGYLEAIDI